MHHLISHRTTSPDGFPWLTPVCGLRFEILLSGNGGLSGESTWLSGIESSGIPEPAIFRVAFSLAQDLWFHEKADSC